MYRQILITLTVYLLTLTVVLKFSKFCSNCVKYIQLHFLSYIENFPSHTVATETSRKKHIVDHKLKPLIPDLYFPGGGPLPIQRKSAGQAKFVGSPIHLRRTLRRHLRRRGDALCREGRQGRRRRRRGRPLFLQALGPGATQQDLRVFRRRR